MLPKTLRIGAHTYEIKSASRKELGEETSGDCDNELNIIRVTKNTTRSREIEILFHECLHAMLAGHDFKDEEAIVVILGEALTSFISDNSRFFTKTIRVLSDSKKS